ELHGEASERFPVDLSVDRILVERFADDGVGFVEMHALGAAQVAHPKGGQVAQIAQTALRGERHDFELVFKEIGTRGDFEWTPVIFGAANDRQRSVEFQIADDNSKMREAVTESFASTLPPVGQNSEASF